MKYVLLFCFFEDSLMNRKLHLRQRWSLKETKKTEISHKSNEKATYEQQKKKI